MDKTIVLEYDEKLVRQVGMKVYLRYIGAWYFAACFFIVLPIVIMLVHGERSWLLGALAVSLAIALYFLWFAYLRLCRAPLQRFRRLGKPVATLEIGETRFKVTSELGSGEYVWKIVTLVWRYDSFWVVFFSPVQFMIWPLANVDQEARDFMMDRLKAARVEIK